MAKATGGIKTLLQYLKCVVVINSFHDVINRGGEDFSERRGAHHSENTSEMFERLLFFLDSHRGTVGSPDGQLTTTRYIDLYMKQNTLVLGLCFCDDKESTFKRRLKAKSMGIFKVKRIVFDVFGVDFIHIDPAVPEISYFKHDVGASNLL